MRVHPEPSRRILITGIGGFVGSHLAEYVLAHGEQVYGSIRKSSRLENITSNRENLNLVECDLTEPSACLKLVNRAQPEWVFHLAGQRFVQASWQDPAGTIMNNVIGQINLLEALKKAGSQARILISGSAEEYGSGAKGAEPISEETPLEPVNPYGVSKVAQWLLARQYWKSYGTKIIYTRAFNHTGPRDGEGFVVPSFARQIALIEKGRQEPVLRVGNLEARRDFLDARDVVRAYWLAMEKCVPGEVYNIASGVARRIGGILEALLKLSRVPIEVAPDPERLRPVDVPVMFGDSSKFREKTGWQPQIPFERTLEDTLNYWRERV